MNRYTALLISGILCSSWSNSAVAELTQPEFEQLMKTVQAAPDATWRTIPWQTSLLNAQRIAARERKPLFIWAMDGHPLGCT